MVPPFLAHSSPFAYHLRFLLFKLPRLGPRVSFSSVCLSFVCGAPDGPPCCAASRTPGHSSPLSSGRSLKIAFAFATLNLSYSVEPLNRCLLDVYCFETQLALCEGWVNRSPVTPKDRPRISCYTPFKAPAAGFRSKVCGHLYDQTRRQTMSTVNKFQTAS